MTLQEFYALSGGSYEEVLGRLMKEERMLKYLKRFPEGQEIASLKQAAASGDWEAAFRAAHTLKGLCANLGLTKLGNESSNLCELLRPCEDPGDEFAEALAVIEQLYEEVVAAINEL